MGIERLNEYSLSSRDKVEGILVEFCINDYQLINGDDYTFWEASYEGLIRHCLRAFPGKPIVSVVLGGKGERFKRKQQHIKRRICRLSRHYRNHYSVDIDDMLHRAYSDSEQFERLYTDVAHFTSEATKQISCLLTEAIVDILKKHKPETTIPEKYYYDKCFDATEVVNLSAADTRVFSNSRIKYGATRLPLGDGRQIRLPGRAIALSYISSSDSRTLNIEFEHERYSIHTLMTAVAKGRSPFLLKNTSLSWRPVQPAAPEIVNFETASETVSDDRLKYQFNMVPPVADKPSAYIVSVLCDVTPSGADEVCSQSAVAAVRPSSGARPWLRRIWARLPLQM